MSTMSMIKEVCFVFLCLFVSVYGSPLVQPITIFPEDPVNGGNATLRCMASDFDVAVHDWKWQRKLSDGSLTDVVASDRILFSPTRHVFSTLYYQDVTISELKESDEEEYLCSVLDVNTNKILSSSGTDLFVYFPNEFPVCTPDGPANVNEGDVLSCETLTDTRVPSIRSGDDPTAITGDWTVGPQIDKRGTVAKYNITKDDVDIATTFLCFSIINSTNKALSCTIGPLTFGSPVMITTSTTSSALPVITTSTTLPLPAIVGIAVGGFLILLLLLTHIICCRCKPKGWLRPKTYFLNFTGFFGTSSNRDGTRREESPVEMAQNSLDQEDTQYGQTNISLNVGAEENIPVPPGLKSEPNIYTEHAMPGPSTGSPPDPNENWHEVNLKAELARVLDDEEDEDD